MWSIITNLRGGNEHLAKRFFKEPVIINVFLLAFNANKVFNLLLGTDKQCLKVELFTSNDTIINKIKPDSKQ